MCVCLLLSAQQSFAFSRINVQAETVVQQDVGTVRNVSVFFDVDKLLLNIKAQAKPVAKPTAGKESKQDWTDFLLDCNVPKSWADGAWRCGNGQWMATGIKVPFSIDITPNLSAFGLGGVADVALKGASFSDVAGLHATEKLIANLHVDLKPLVKSWEWNADLNWLSGEVFWQPIYFANGGHRLTASGSFDEQNITFDNARLLVKDVGDVTFTGQLDSHTYQLKNFKANLPNLNLAKAYPLLFQPFLGNTALNNADIEGKAALDVMVDNGQLKAFKLHLDDADIADKAKHFAFYKLNADVPWSYDDVKQVKFAYESGQLLNLPLGKTNLQAQVNRYSLTSPKMVMPILDGALNLEDISAARIADKWYWHLRANVNPISMDGLSGALKLPKMQGKVSAQIPLVTYAAGNLTTDGDMSFSLFDGVMTVTNLSMQTPLGSTPKLYADVALRNLDLGSLTRTFSFGAIEGKLDGDVNQLELQNWKVVKLDAKVQSSQGDYPRKISQRAVENISALGGAGAAAAVQRSFLRFFKQFNYDKLGISCQLRKDTCLMGGIESTQQGFVIVKGAGIPAITVMGYNQTVGWGDLIGRLKRITEENTKAVIVK